MAVADVVRSTISSVRIYDFTALTPVSIIWVFNALGFFLSGVANVWLADRLGFGLCELCQMDFS